jgi:hypothetical protein
MRAKSIPPSRVASAPAAKVWTPEPCIWSDEVSQARKSMSWAESGLNL